MFVHEMVCSYMRLEILRRVPCAFLIFCMSVARYLCVFNSHTRLGERCTEAETQDPFISQTNGWANSVHVRQGMPINAVSLFLS